VKKRIRKKRRVGEFREWGCEVVVELRSAAAFDEFLDGLVSEVEKMSCYCGGGGSGKSLSLIVELGTMLEGPEARRDHLSDWLAVRADVESYCLGPLIDLWRPESISANQRNFLPST